MHIVLAPIRLKHGQDEKTLLEASDAFQVNFVSKQAGIVNRMLLRGKNGEYADLVFFKSKDDFDRVAKLEETSEECVEFFKIMELPDEGVPDMRILSFEHMKSYERD